MSYTEKKDMHISYGYSITTCYSYDKTLNKTKYYRGFDCVEKFSQDLKKILNNCMYFEEKSMLPLTDNEKVLYANKKQCYICENFGIRYVTHPLVLENGFKSRN